MAHWLAAEGFPRVSILEGGIRAWRAEGFPVEAVEIPGSGAPASESQAGLALAEHGRPAAFLPSLAERYLADGALPARRRLATLFVDIAGSTRLLVDHSPEVALDVVQRFMRLVTDVALAYCGDVKDFEGDGALLYFESAAEATQAALALRAALGGRPAGPGAVTARMSLTVGEVAVGVIGSAMRRAVTLIGPSVSVGARLLKEIQPGGVIASGEVVEALRPEAPSLAARFRLLDPSVGVRGADGMTVATYELV